MLTDEQMRVLCEMLRYFPAFAEEKEAFNRLTATEKRCKDAER